MKNMDYWMITLIIIFFVILVSIQFTLNQILKTLREIKNHQEIQIKSESKKHYRQE